MAQIEIQSERELPGGWRFEVHILDGAGRIHPVRLVLSWADYNLWSPDGGDAPERVAEAVLAFLLSRQPAAQIRADFDAALVRRMFSDADQAIPGFIQRSH